MQKYYTDSKQNELEDKDDRDGMWTNRSIH